MALRAVQNSDGNQVVLYLYCNDNEWVWNYNWLSNNNWNANDQLFTLGHSLSRDLSQPLVILPISTKEVASWPVRRLSSAFVSHNICINSLSVSIFFIATAK